MVRLLSRALLAALVSVAAVLGTLVLGVRLKYPPVVGFVRRTLRDRANPAALATAGSAGDSHDLVVHEGRRTGRTFRTPVTAFAVDDCFVIALPYGPEADWVRNVVTAGGATLHKDGEEIAVTRPEVRALSEYASSFRGGDRLALTLFGVTDCLRLHRASI